LTELSTCGICFTWFLFAISVIPNAIPRDDKEMKFLLESLVLESILKSRIPEVLVLALKYITYVTIINQFEGLNHSKYSIQKSIVFQ
jgi:hypothetical protein